MARQLEQVKQKGLGTSEWQRLYDRHQQEYNRKRLRAIKAAMEHAQIILDNITQRQKMKGLYLEEVQKLGLEHGREIKKRLVFTFLPAYSPKLNQVE